MTTGTITNVTQSRLEGTIKSGIHLETKKNYINNKIQEKNIKRVLHKHAGEYTTNLISSCNSTRASSN